ncbi:MAG: hypothetical protein AAB946_00065, partial [Patescibacteria group bacterium]
NQKVSAAELRKAKDFLIGGMYLGLESSDALANFYGSQEIMREKIKTPKEVEREIEKVTAHELQKVAQTILVNKGLNMALVGKCKRGEENDLKKILRI